MAAGQRDIPVLLQPGSGATVRAPGEFLYLKFADREIQAIITGQDGTQSRVKMVTGDFTKPAGGVSEIELVNPDTGNPCAVVVTVGDGEFDRKIIQGDVSITPVIRTANGQTRNDSRRTISLDASPQYESGGDFVPGDIRVETTTDYGDRWVSMNGKYYSFAAMPGVPGSMVAWQRDVRTLEVVGQSAMFNSIAGTPYTNTAPNYCCGGQNGLIYGIWYTDWLASINPTTGEVALIANVSRQDNDAITGLIIDYPLAFITSDTEALEIWNLESGNRAGTETLPQNVESIVTGYRTEPGVFQVYDRSSSTVYTVRRVAGGTWKEIDDRDLKQAGEPFPTSGGVVPALGPETVVIKTGTGMTKRTTRPFTVPLEGLALIAGCGSLYNRLVKRRALESANETRGLVTVDWIDRRCIVRGEIIRLLIEWYTGELAPDDYLDHVYGARLFRPTDNSAERAVMTGAETFAKAGIADDFEIYLPARVELIVDNELATSPLF